MTVRFFTLDAPESKWCDYGDILIHGMVGHLPRQDGFLQLERTGPHLPPITFPGPGAVVLTGAAKRRLETSGLTGFTFRPVLKARIVTYDWHTWRSDTDEPLEYPESGEPEDYILSRPHDDAVAEALGEVWELVIHPSARIVRGSGIRLVSASWNGADLFRSDEVLYTYASAKARAWFEGNFHEHVAFAETPTA